MLYSILSKAVSTTTHNQYDFIREKIMKKIMISSMLAITACFTMVSQASAAPQIAKHHVAQVKHQKVNAKFDNKHQHVKKKAVVSKHQSKNQRLISKQKQISS